ncbi:MAG: response regulator transcription factor, partial [Saprospiraceae bacterium]|nr:response regulator transcription factor [Saprospiraceae bacterium]
IELLEGSEDIKVIGEASNLNDARACIEAERPTVILQDISLRNNENGIAFTKEINGKYPSIQIIALTMHNEPSMIREMIKNGARGYLLKDSSKEELIEALRKVVQGDTYFSGRVQETIMNSLSQGAKSSSGNFPKLSRREKEILMLIVKEFTTAEIAEKLFVSTGTIETHRRNMLSKLGVRNTAGLVRVAYEQGLID